MLPRDTTYGLENEVGGENVSIGNARFSRDDFVLLIDRAKSWLVPSSNIVTLEANGNDTIVNLADSKISVRRLLGKCEIKLDPLIFFRTGRSCIVNLNYVKKTTMADAKRFMFVMQNGKEIILSRKQSLYLKRAKSL